MYYMFAQRNNNLSDNAITCTRSNNFVSSTAPNPVHRELQFTNVSNFHIPNERFAGLANLWRLIIFIECILIMFNVSKTNN